MPPGPDKQTVEANSCRKCVDSSEEYRDHINQGVGHRLRYSYGHTYKTLHKRTSIKLTCGFIQALLVTNNGDTDSGLMAPGDK